MAATSTLSTITSPMLSVFTPPLFCSRKWTFEAAEYNSIPGGPLIQHAQYGSSYDDACLPTGFDGWGRAPSFIQVFSPGACPTGYTTAANFYAGQVTTAVCCLDEFPFVSTVSIVRLGNKTAQYFGCTSVYPADAAVTTVFAEDGDTLEDLDGTSTYITAVAGPVTMWAQPITVAYEKADLTLFATTTVKASDPSPTDSTTRTSSSTVSHRARLSGGAIAGIATGISIVLGLIIGAAILYRKRRRDLALVLAAREMQSRRHSPVQDYS